ncbi:MAG: redoxin domain-containing protein [Chloroflexi bacterium]|nr:redoxin domain-containing protein [Chloroflexota bacterium]
MTIVGEERAQPMVGDPAPAFELSDPKGNSMSLDELRGQFVVIHFGTTW